MHRRMFLVAGLMLVFAAGAGAETADPATVTPATTTPAPEGAAAPAPPAVVPPVRVVPEKPKPPEKPRADLGKARPAEIAPAAPVVSPVEPPPPVAVPEPANPMKGAPAPADEANGGFAFACVALSFAMLIIGFAAGFIARHYWSRHKLGGMTVRIGTWRGVP